MPGRNPKHCNFTGALNSSRWLSFAQPGDKDHLLPIYWKGLLPHSLSRLNAASALSPNPSQTFAEWTWAQLGSLHRFSSHCDPARLPAIHMCYFPFVVMACGTWPENIINFRSELTNNKPAVKQEEVPGRPAVGLSPAVGTLSVCKFWEG